MYIIMDWTAALLLAVVTYAIYYIWERESKEVVKKTLVINTINECNEFVGLLYRSFEEYRFRIIGFDCEWVSAGGKRRPVALVQIALHDGLCALIRISKLLSVPDSLKMLLEDPTVYKVGVATFDDAQNLFKDFSVHTLSTLDLRYLAVLSGYEARGLAKLAMDVCGTVLDKSWNVRCGNWEAEILSERQISYASEDARSALAIFRKMLFKMNMLINSQQVLLTETEYSKIEEICSPYLNRRFKYKRLQSEPESEAIQNLLSPQQLFETSKRNNKTFNYTHSVRSKPLYHNCFLLAPDGEVLCTCDTKKARWYADRGLADVVCNDPLTVCLRFEPAARNVGAVNRYYSLVKENKCVVCGKTESYIRKNVVPREYRQYFPEAMKDHSSHDVLLLCAPCHQRSNMHDGIYREILAVQCSAPLQDPNAPKFIEDTDIRKVRSAARALLHQSGKHSIPEERKDVLKKIVLDYFPSNVQYNTELLEEAAELEYTTENPSYESHGKCVTDFYRRLEGGLFRLEAQWRQHFLTTMRPKEMPELWSVHHNRDRLRIKWQEGRLTAEDIINIGYNFTANQS